jgi:hypothetical protein
LGLSSPTMPRSPDSIHDFGCTALLREHAATPLHHIGARAPIAKRMARRWLRLLYSAVCAARGANQDCFERHSDVYQPSRTMSLITAIGHVFRRDADNARFERLDRLLAKLGCDLDRELEALAGANERIAACAAFAFEALENGENSDRMSARLNTLTEAMERRRERLALVMLQREFVKRTRKELSRLRQSEDRTDRARKRPSKTLPGAGPYAVWRRLPHDKQA